MNPSDWSGYVLPVLPVYFYFPLFLGGIGLIMYPSGLPGNLLSTTLLVLVTILSTRNSADNLKGFFSRDYFIG
jgi:hypothetical protein